MQFFLGLMLVVSYIKVEVNMYRTYTFPIYPKQEAREYIENVFEELHILILNTTKFRLNMIDNPEMKIKYVPSSTLRYINSISSLIINHQRHGVDQDNTFFIKLRRHAFFQSVNFFVNSEIVLKSRNGLLYKISYRMTDYVKGKLALGSPISIKIFMKQRKFLASVLIRTKPVQTNGLYKAGLDIGVKVPAVIYTEQGNIRFYKGGKLRRYLFTKQASLLKNSKIELSRKLKVSRKLKNLDHKISSMIVKDLIELRIKKLNIEDLKYIQLDKTKQLYSSWSYERLQRFVIYKCESNDIKVVKVDPRFTSQQCPNCRKLNKALKRVYLCSCGYKHHRDVVGALNVMNK
jgi:IS605 OrfB family transposase